MTTTTLVTVLSWGAFANVVHNFLDNKKADNYSDMVEELFLNLQELASKMSIKVHHLYSHLSEFSESLDNEREEQGKLFRENIKVMEERYQGQGNCNVMADNCWSLIRDVPYAVYKRSAIKRKVMKS